MQLDITFKLQFDHCNNFKLIKRQSCHYKETSQLICSANQLTGFYMMATSAFNVLIGCGQECPGMLKVLRNNAGLIYLEICEFRKLQSS